MTSPATPSSQTFSNVQVVPYVSLAERGQPDSYHRGGPIWPDWDNQLAARHCINGYAVDDPPEPVDGGKTIEAAQWCGPVHWHFGHILAEFGMRILPSALNDNPAPLLFSCYPLDSYRAAKRPIHATPKVFRDIVRYAGIRPGDVRIAVRALTVENLSVVPQAEQMFDIGPNPAHLDLLEQHAEDSLGPVQPDAGVFVSRAGKFARFAGETYIEQVMTKAGVRVMRPETLPLVEQLTTYRNAAFAIFSEGSALHVPQLLGRCFDRVDVLERGNWGRPFNQASLRPRTRHLGYHAPVSGLAEMLGPDGKPRRLAALSFVDADRLVASIEQIGLPFARHWNNAHFHEAARSDAEAWLASARTRPHWANPGTADKVFSAFQTYFGDSWS